MDNKFKIVSQAGVGQVAGVLGTMMIAIGGIYLVIDMIIDHKKDSLENIIGQPIASLVMIFLAYSLIKQKVTLDQDGLTSQDGWRKEHIPWKGIYRISVVPGYGYLPFAGFSIWIHTMKRERPMSVIGLMFYNSHEIVKAIIEMADEVNSGIAIDATLIHSYGRPPYGVVVAERAKLRP